MSKPHYSDADKVLLVMEALLRGMTVVLEDNPVCIDYDESNVLSTYVELSGQVGDDEEQTYMVEADIEAGFLLRTAQAMDDEEAAALAEALEQVKAAVLN
jgi:hypothetical protein